MEIVTFEMNPKNSFEFFNGFSKYFFIWWSKYRIILPYENVSSNQDKIKIMYTYGLLLNDEDLRKYI
jgi:hypothetical protein